MVFRKLDMPKAHLKTIATFFLRCKKVLTVNGHCAKEKMGARNGLLQGCPLSMLLMAAIKLMWIQAMIRAALLGMVFVDDRNTIIRGKAHGQTIEKVKATLEISRLFDEAVGFDNNLDKLQLASTSLELRNLLATLTQLLTTPGE